MSSSEPGRPQPATRPAQSPRARVAALLIAVALLCLALVCLRELWVWYADPTGWTSWVAAGVDQLQNMPPNWLFWGGIGGFLIGAWFLVAAFKPRVKPYLALTSSAPVWVRRVDLARYATAVIKIQPGVLAASTLVTRKKAVVTATVAHPDEATRSRLTAHLQESLRPLVGDRLQLSVVVRHDEELSGPLAEPAEKGHEGR